MTACLEADELLDESTVVAADLFSCDWLSLLSAMQALGLHGIERKSVFKGSQVSEDDVDTKFSDFYDKYITQMRRFANRCLEKHMWLNTFWTDRSPSITWPASQQEPLADEVVSELSAENLKVAQF